jgi:hypothetical protein
MPQPRTPATPRRMILAAAGLALGLVAVVLASGGCTSDPENAVGAPLVETVFDTTLVPVEIAQVDKYSSIDVVDADVPVFAQQLVYLGEQGGTRSNILANFDFSFTEITRNDSIYPDSLFTFDNIKSVRFSLIKPNPYRAIRDSISCTGEGDDVVCDTTVVSTGQPLDLYYLLRELEAPFSQIDYVSYPNEVPPVRGNILNSDFDVPNTANEPFMRMFKEDFLRWFEGGAPIGIMVQLDAQSDPGLVGYASQENRRPGSQFDDLQEGTVLAPNIVVEFNDFVGLPPNNFFLMEPIADTSTFDAVEEAPGNPADGVLLRTGMRTYPAFFFDFSTLPANARINRAVLSLTNDKDRSFGPAEDLATAEIDTVEFGDPYRTITMAEYRQPEFVFLLSGEREREPETLDVLELEVTPAVQRYINRVTEGTKGIFLAAWEFPPLSGGGGRIVPVDFYYREFHFFGTAAAPEQRPKLQVTYTLVDELEGEGN